MGEGITNFGSINAEIRQSVAQVQGGALQHQAPLRAVTGRFSGACAALEEYLGRHPWRLG